MTTNEIVDLLEDDYDLSEEEIDVKIAFMPPLEAPTAISDEDSDLSDGETKEMQPTFLEESCGPRLL